MKRLVIILLILLAFGSLWSNTWLGKDKISHFSSSLFLTCYTGSYARNFLDIEPESSKLVAAGFCISAGLGKEWNDLYIKKTSWSWPDLVWDAAGICCGIILLNNNVIK